MKTLATRNSRNTPGRCADHVIALGRKSYFEQFANSPDFVVLFLPGEVFYTAALQQDPELIEAGVNDRVLITSPTSLIALLRAVAYGWRQEQLADNARHISELGQELYKRLATLAEHFAAVGKALDKSVTAYNKAVVSLENRVLPGHRKFKELGAASTAESIEVMKPLETDPRSIQAPELLAIAEEKTRNTDEGRSRSRLPGGTAPSLYVARASRCMPGSPARRRDLRLVLQNLDRFIQLAVGGAIIVGGGSSGVGLPLVALHPPLKPLH